LQKEVEAGRLTLPKNGNVEVAVRLADGSMYPHTGRLNFSDVRISTATGSQEARAELPNKEGDLRPGQFVRVVLRGATRPNAVAVPQRAVLEGPQGKFVYVVNDKSAAEPRPVEVGDWAGDTWIITSGLKGGEQVIVDGVMKIGPGAPVKVAEKPAEKPVAAKQPEKSAVGKK
jgi:membrane fusion protein (multidrug efflux system)